MQTVVLPLRLIANQALLLLVAIAIEAAILRRRLKYPPRRSIEYSASINIASTLIGWLVFFAVAGSIPLLPALKLELINFIFLNRWSQGLFSWVVIVGFSTFFLTVSVERLSFTLLKHLRKESESRESKYNQYQRRLPRYITSRRSGPGTGSAKANGGDGGEPLYALLVANAASYAAIVAILVGLQLVS